MKKFCGKKDYVDEGCQLACGLCNKDTTTSATTTTTAANTTESTPQSLKVLFIGNSYTQGMPEYVKKLAEDQGLILEYTSINPGARYFFHHVKGLGGKMIKNGGWDAVILQEQSLTLAAHDYACKISVKYANELVDLIHTHNPAARVIWFLTWGYRNGYKNTHGGIIPVFDTFEGELRSRQSQQKYVIHLGGTPDASCEILEKKFFPLISLYMLSASRLDFWTEEMTIST